jgi:ribonuclease HI
VLGDAGGSQLWLELNAVPDYTRDMAENAESLGETVLIYTDGACSGNPGKGGWGAIVYLPPGDVYELGGAKFKTTNNQMELTATIEALESLDAEDMTIWLYTDSTYVIRGITQWIWGWKKNGWKNSEVSLSQIR